MFMAIGCQTLFIFNKKLSTTATAQVVVDTALRETVVTANCVWTVTRTDPTQGSPGNAIVRQSTYKMNLLDRIKTLFHSYRS